MAEDPYRMLFARYVADLESSRRQALAWWEALVAAEQARRGLDEPAARRRVAARWPCGPTSHPRVLEVYRRYFLACQQLNQDRPTAGTAKARPFVEADWGDETDAQEPEPPGPVPPNVFAIDWLAGKHPELQTLMAGLLLAPIGLADDGLFC